MREHEQRLTKGYKLPNWYFRSKLFLSRNGTFWRVQCHEGAGHQRQVVERGRDTAEVCVQDSSSFSSVEWRSNPNPSLWVIPFLPLPLTSIGRHSLVTRLSSYTTAQVIF